MKRIKNLYGKMVDYKNYGFVLLAVSVFLYLGSVIPSGGKTIHDPFFYLGGTIIFLFFSAYFLKRSNYYRKLLLEDEEGQKYMYHKK